ncbi:MAG TPA: hypothetical protein VG097_05490 [Gemmata sp.]|nr:hypothetical protein [Gemmata sp.]
MRYFFVSICAFVLPAVAAAQGYVESVSPPVLERGKTARITFIGRDLGMGLDVWNSLPKGSITAKPIESHADRLVIDLTASSDAPVGVCGLRIATRDGLTNAVLFHIEDLPVRGNIASEKPVSLTLPACVWGTFRTGTRDVYTITVAAGEKVSFEAVSNRLGKDADPLITIRDATGRFVTERDNDQGLYFDFRFEYTFEKAGVYTVEIRDARFKASEHHHYILRMGKFPEERVSTAPTLSPYQPLPGVFFENRKRPSDNGSSWVPVPFSTEGPFQIAREFDERRDIGFSQAVSGQMQLGFLLAPTRVNPFLPLERLATIGRFQATPVSVPGTLCGVLRKPGQRQAFSFTLDKGQRIFVRAETKVLNSPIDIDYVLTDRLGREVRRPNENRDGTEPALDYTAATPGEYALVIRDILREGSDSHAFRLTVRDRPFPPSINAEVEGLTIPQGSYQSVPLQISKTGRSGPIRLLLLGAPAGVKLSPDEIPETATSIVCRLEANSATPIGTYTVQIVALCNTEIVLVASRPLIDKKLMNIDLIPIALREDQTRPPPSLCDRFAVQITPPSPFTFELPEQTVTLCRYQTSSIPVVTSRIAGFDGPISFHAVGGQLADKREGRTRVYAEFPDATVKQPSISGVVVSKILSNIAKTRIEVSASGVHQGRKVTLSRTFDLDLVTAFRFPAEQVKVAMLPGESATVNLSMLRAKSFDGPMTFILSPMPGLEFPETVTIPKGQNSVSFSVKAADDLQPRRQGMSIHATGDVDGFEEEIRGQPIEIEVKKVEPPKKK